MRDQLARVHTRFARAALAIYLGVAATGIVMLVIAFASDRDHDENQRRERLLLLTDERAHALGLNLGLLTREITRLGLRDEMDLQHPADPGAAARLLKVAHEKSTLFNVGVAVLDTDGRVRDAEPSEFLAAGTSYADRPWFATMMRTGRPAIVPIEPARVDDAIIYVVSPVTRGDKVTGALIGAIDLAHERASSTIGLEDVPLGQTVLATADGSVVYPARPPEWASDPAWKEQFAEGLPSEPTTSDLALDGKKMITAGAPVTGTNLELVRLVERTQLYHEASSRLLRRLAVGLSIALIPLVVLVLLLRSSLSAYRRAEEAAVREERLSHLGEAANLIAHEVKNGLNGLRMGLELIQTGSGTPSGERVAHELRGEIERLSEFTTELMTFSRGIEPRPVKLDLASFTPKIADLSREAAADAGIAIELSAPATPVPVRADPTLLHVVVKNLLGNAIDALSAKGADGRIDVTIAADARDATLRVRDNGPGVAKSVREQLFEPFVTGKPSGVGIGLALSRRIARAHGGELTLEQTPSGASFLLTLPLAKKEEAAT